MTTRHRPPVTFVIGVGEHLVTHDSHLRFPPVDVVEEPTGWRLVFETPGALPDSLKVEIRGKVVTVRGDRKATEGEPGCFLRVERSAGRFERSLELPDEGDPEGSRASYVNGILTLFIPRVSGSRARTIPIQGRRTKD